MDFWVGQHRRPEVWIEKDALLSIVSPVCHKYDVNYYSLRGWGRPTDKFEAADRFAEYGIENQRSVILHLGDYDPTGCAVTNNLMEEIPHYMNEVHGGCSMTVRRVALNRDQIDKYELKPNLIDRDENGNEILKDGESRYRAFVRENMGRKDTWELDSLEPKDLQDIVEAAIVACINDNDAWNRRQEEITLGAGDLSQMIAKLNLGV